MLEGSQNRTKKTRIHSGYKTWQNYGVNRSRRQFMTGIRESLASKDQPVTITGRVFIIMVTVGWSVKEFLSICDGGNTNIQDTFRQKDYARKTNLKEPSGSGGINFMPTAPVGQESDLSPAGSGQKKLMQVIGNISDFLYTILYPGFSETKYLTGRNV